MAARLELEFGIGALPGDAQDHFLVTAHVGFAARNHFNLPALALGVARVHAEQIGGEQGRLFAAGAGANFEEQITFVIRIARQQ